MFNFRKRKYYRLIVCCNDEDLLNAAKTYYLDILRKLDGTDIYELRFKDITTIYLTTNKRFNLKQLNDQLVLGGAYLIKASPKDATLDFLMADQYGKIIKY